MDYWLNPNGQLIEVKDCGHNDYASNLLESEMESSELFDYMERERVCYPYEILHIRGWVRISVNCGRVSIYGGCVDLTQPMRNTMSPAMNEAQIDVAKKLCRDNDTPFSQAINDKRFW